MKRSLPLLIIIFVLLAAVGGGALLYRVKQQRIAASQAAAAANAAKALSSIKLGAHPPHVRGSARAPVTATFSVGRAAICLPFSRKSSKITALGSG